MSQPPPTKPTSPTLLSQRTSAFTLGLIGTLAKAFTFGFNRQQVHGADTFLEVLESRRDPEARKRGLITGRYDEVSCVRWREADFVGGLL